MNDDRAEPTVIVEQVLVPVWERALLLDRARHADLLICAYHGRA